jgi:hypothetical protein
MNDALIQSIGQRFGWTLVHSVWQFALVAFVRPQADASASSSPLTLAWLLTFMLGTMGVFSLTADISVAQTSTKPLTATAKPDEAVVPGKVATPSRCWLGPGSQVDPTTNTPLTP